MGLCLGKTPGSASPSSPHWPDLPPEIAGHIQSRLGSHDDRLSFGAVCSEWRLAARQHGPLQPPAMPCINLGNGRYRSITDGKVRRFPTPKGYRAGASFGRWLFYYREGSGRSFLRAPSSGDAVEVPINYHSSSFIDFPMAMTTWAFRTLPDIMHMGRGMDMKMIVCSSQLVVALLHRPGRGYFHPISYLASFRPAQLQTRLRALAFAVQSHDPVCVYRDITFYHGNIFALSCWEELFCHDIHGHKNYIPIVYHGTEARPAMLRTNCYLVESSDKQKLLMVWWERRSITGMDLRVFEAHFGMGRWVEVKDLGDQVLFLGKNSSMALASRSTDHLGQKFRGGNRVFILGTEWAWSLAQPISCKRDIPSYCVYDMTSGETSLVFLDGARYVESCMSGWFFP